MSSTRAGFWGRLLLSAMLPTVFSCSQHDKVAGSEIGNPTTVALSGTALYPDGRPAGGAKVTLRRTDYLAEDAGNSLLPTSSRTALSKKTGLAKAGIVRTGAWTDNQGHFTVDSVDQGQRPIGADHQAAFFRPEFHAIDNGPDVFFVRSATKYNHRAPADEGEIGDSEIQRVDARPIRGSATPERRA